MKGIKVKVIKRGLYKKKLAPKGYTWLIVSVKKNKTTYTMKDLIPVQVGKDLEDIRSEQMINELTKYYKI